MRPLSDRLTIERVALKLGARVFDPKGRRYVGGYYHGQGHSSAPPPPKWMIIGEAPGFNEDRAGRPFIGETGREMDRLLKQAGVSIRSFFLTNVVKYRPFTNKATGNSSPTLTDIARDEPDLIREIQFAQPEWIIAVGRVAARWLFDADVDMEDLEGFAYPNLPRARGAIVIVARHPASGFHSPEQQPLIYWDFMRAGQYLRGELPPIPPTDQYPKPIYYEWSKYGQIVNLGRNSTLVTNSKNSDMLAVAGSYQGQRVWRDWEEGKKFLRSSSSVRTSKGTHTFRSHDRPSLQSQELRATESPRSGNSRRESKARSRATSYLLSRSLEDSRELTLEDRERPQTSDAAVHSLQKVERERLLRSLLPDPNQEVAVDTEGTKETPWCLTLSNRPGTALLVHKADAAQILPWFRGRKLILHNSLWDLPVLASLFGMDLLQLLEQINFEDSMQAAYVLRLLPKGLKALGRRFKGVEMEDYHSVVADADQRIMIEWLTRVTRHQCAVCGGEGQVITQPTSAKTGKLLAERLTPCEACEGDGTAWMAPEEQLVVKGQKITISRGRRLGWRTFNILKDKGKVDPESGRAVDLRKRWEDLKKKDHEFGVQAELTLGPPRPVSLGDIPFKKAKRYACLDADVTKRVWPDLEAELDREGLRGVYEMDRAVIPMVTRMMDVGWKLDTAYLNHLTNKLTIQQDKILFNLESLVGRPFNPNSTDQVGEILFGELGLHPVRMTDSGQESTDSKVLNDLRIHCNARAEGSKRHRRAYEILTGILDWKERGKLKSTYTLPLPRQVDRYSRLHTQIKLATVESGRLASAAPNLQNISSRTALGKLVRRAFIAEEGHVLVGVDLAQIEMRVLAHLANERLLIKAIKRGLDVHALTTSKIFGIPIDKVTKEMWQRDAAKTLGFGIVYGISAPALKTQIKLQSGRHTKGGVDIPIEQCQEWIEEYTHTTYPGVGEFMQDSQADARRVGYVESMYKRRRYLPGVHSPINKVRAEAERIATNHRIQGTAADIEKLAMAQIWEETLPRFRKRGYTECIMQEHDALFFETLPHLADELLAEVIRVKCEVVRLKVPVDADGHVGVNWAQVKEGGKYVA